MNAITTKSLADQQQHSVGRYADAYPPVLAAHSPNDQGRWHSLVDHLAGTGKRAREFGAAFGSADICRLVGELHDLGKADPAWQRYLAAAAAGTKLPTVDHKYAGAALCREWGLSTLAMIIAGHHGGLPDVSQFKAKLADAPTDGHRAAIQCLDELGITRRDGAVVPERFRPVSTSDRAGSRRLEFWMRMVFSALIDADRLDTEEHFRSGQRRVVTYGSLGDLDQRCRERHIHAVAERASDPLASARTEILEEALAHATDPPGWFELTAPTGSGKTITGLSFALRHATANGQRRVVMAVPFISVTEQVASEYRYLLDADAANPVVLEHHSGMAAHSESQTGPGLWARLAAENWDARVIVTTTVQLLESLFENSTSRTRKLHRLANCVLLIDEVQSLPWPLLEPTLDVLRELVRSYGCSVVFSTATQPPFGQIGDVQDFERRSLIDQRWFDVFSRTNAEVIRDPLSWRDIASRIIDESERNDDQCLVVLNTIKDSQAVCAILDGQPGLMYLSSRLCQSHRLHVLNSVRSALQRGDPCTLVSTQIVEAGIDIDFPVAMRAVGPLPAIAQVAGRVNRHGLRQRGILVVVDPSEGSVPPREYKIGTEITRELLRAGRDPFALETLETYYDRMIHATRDKLDTKGIQRERECLNYETVAKNYRVIADETIPVFVRYGDFDPSCIAIPADPTLRRNFLRGLQKYTVSLRAKEAKEAQDAGLIDEREGNVLVWCGEYHNTYGLVFGTEREALIL